MTFSMTEKPKLYPEALKARLVAALGSTEIYFLSGTSSREQLLESLQTVIVESGAFHLGPEDIECVLRDAQRLLVVDITSTNQSLSHLMTEAVDLLKAEVNEICQLDLLFCIQATEELQLDTIDECIKAAEPLALEDSTLILGEMCIAKNNRVLLILAQKEAPNQID